MNGNDTPSAALKLPINHSSHSLYIIIYQNDDKMTQKKLKIAACQREGNAENISGAVAVRPDSALVALDNLLGDGKTETETAVVFSCLVHSVEADENVFQLILRYRLAFVSYYQLCLFSVMNAELGGKAHSNACALL